MTVETGSWTNQISAESGNWGELFWDEPALSAFSD